MNIRKYWAAMRSSIRAFFTCFATLGCSIALAMSPEPGIWWNPNESGSGYVLEIQDNTLAFATYSYEADGIPTWYLSAGKMTGDNRFSGQLMKSVGGQCITCSYRSPTQAAVGTLDIFFDSASTATLTFNGTRATRIQRFAYAINEATPHKMMGEWAFTTGSSAFPVYFGDRIGFSGTRSSSTGKLHATGARTGASNNIAVASQDADGSWSILLDSSSSYYTYFSFTFSGLNTMEGRSWTFLKTSSLSGQGLPFIAQRSGSLTSITTGVGPALRQLKSEYEAGFRPSTTYESVDQAKVGTGTMGPGEGVDAGVVEKARIAVERLLRF